MADAEAPASAGAGGLKEALGRKLGPLPAGVWIAIAIAVFYYMSKKQKGGTGALATDSAGNVGTIDPNTGYVSGSPQDRAALGNVSSGLGTGTEPGTTGGATVSGQYADNNAWAVAAINYLVSIGVDATSANTAVTQFLSSQVLTSQQQGEINLAIQRLGAPPSPPEPGGNVPPIVTPPSSATYATNPPSGFTTSTVTASSIAAKWNAATNAVSYTMSWGTTPDAADGRTTVSTLSATATGLKANTLYHVRVQANPVKDSSAGFASLTATTPKAAGPTPTPTPKPTAKPPIAVVVRQGSGDSYSSIGASHHYKGTGEQLWVYNYTSSPHSAEAKAKLKAQGKNRLYGGQTVYVPQ